MFRLVYQRLAPKLANVARRPVFQAQQKVLPVATSFIRKSSSTAIALTDEEKDAKWVAYFDSEDLDYFDFYVGFHDLWQEDAVPEPMIIQSALYACRRLNHLPAALRCLELIRVKCVDKKEIYDYIIQELGPTLDDLGLKTPEQLGLDKVEQLPELTE